MLLDLVSEGQGYPKWPRCFYLGTGVCGGRAVLISILEASCWVYSNLAFYGDLLIPRHCFLSIYEFYLYPKTALRWKNFHLSWHLSLWFVVLCLLLPFHFVVSRINMWRRNWKRSGCYSVWSFVKNYLWTFASATREVRKCSLVQRFCFFPLCQMQMRS